MGGRIPAFRGCTGAQAGTNQGPGAHDQHGVPAARCFSDGARGFIPIDHIVGMIDEETGRRSALRLSGRGIARQWDRLFNQDNHDACPSLTVLKTARGWYLTGGAASLVRLEVLRAKGHRTIWVTRACRGTGAPFRGIFVSSGGCGPAYEIEQEGGDYETA